MTIAIWCNLICCEKCSRFLPNFFRSVTWPNQRQTKSFLKTQKGKKIQTLGDCCRGSRISCTIYTLLLSPLFTMTNVYQAFSYDHSIKYFWEPSITIQQRLFLWLVQPWLGALKWLGYCWLFSPAVWTNFILFHGKIQFFHFFSNIISFLLSS